MQHPPCARVLLDAPLHTAPDRTFEPLARTRGSGPCTLVPPLPPACTVDSTGRAENTVFWTASLRDSLSRVRPASDVSDLAWPAADNRTDSEEPTGFPAPLADRHPQGSSPSRWFEFQDRSRMLHLVPDGIRIVSNRTATDPPFLTNRRASSCSRCAVCTPRRSISRSAAAAGQPHRMSCDTSTRATRCACPLDVSTSSRPCSAKRSRPPVLRFRNRSGVDSFHGFLCS